MKIIFSHKFKDITCVDNLLEAWAEFLIGKKGRKDVQEFQFRLMDNILSLHRDLINGSYRHGGYQCFNIVDPKPRVIHKANVRDRILHRAVYRILYPFFDRKFISDSFSCRIGKGTHRAVLRFRTFARKVSRNNAKTAWVLKCDIKKFFASIDQEVLLNILREHICDAETILLLSKIIASFNSGKVGKGLPLGNLTSQLLSNIYMDKFDQFVKHKIKAKYYIRYADDFVVLSMDKEWLKNIVPVISNFLISSLKLRIHPGKVSIKTVASGVDFLGWVSFSDHLVLRGTTKKRMFRNITSSRRKSGTVQSYLGLIKHGNTIGIREDIQCYLSDSEKEKNGPPSISSDF